VFYMPRPFIALQEWNDVSLKFFLISYGLSLVACSNSELLLKLWIIDTW
jgi:hypothetical protein